MFSLVLVFNDDVERHRGEESASERSGAENFMIADGPFAAVLVLWYTGGGESWYPIGAIVMGGDFDLSSARDSCGALFRNFPLVGVTQNDVHREVPPGLT